MPGTRSFNVVGVHAAGEVCDVVVGGVLDVPGQTMYDKMMQLWKKADGLRLLLLNEPRGSAAMCTNLVLPPCNPGADAGFIIMEHEEYPPMSGANTVATATVLLETGMVPMREPLTRLTLDTPAGLVTVDAECENGKCISAAFNNVPAFVFELDVDVPVPGIGTVRVDIAWGGMIYALVDASSVGLKIESANGRQLVEVGERIKRAVQQHTNPVHPEDPRIQGVSILEFTEPFKAGLAHKAAVNTVVVSPGRLDRSPCGTGTCARLAVLHARRLLDVDEPFHHLSIIGTEFKAHIRGTTRLGDYPAVLPTVKGRAWITSYKQVVLDPSDPFPEGFRVGDVWQM
ncbi:4-hydroxyproline 2-epimerase 1 [Exophiala dermatitidis]